MQRPLLRTVECFVSLMRRALGSREPRACFRSASPWASQPCCCGDPSTSFTSPISPRFLAWQSNSEAVHLIVFRPSSWACMENSVRTSSVLRRNSKLYLRNRRVPSALRPPSRRSRATGQRGNYRTLRRAEFHFDRPKVGSRLRPHSAPSLKRVVRPRTRALPSSTRQTETTYCPCPLRRMTSRFTPIPRFSTLSVLAALGCSCAEAGAHY